MGQRESEIGGARTAYSLKGIIDPNSYYTAHEQRSLLPGPQAVLQRRYRGPERQGQSHHEKVLRLPHLQSH